MKIKEWIMLGSILVILSFSKALAAPSTPASTAPAQLTVDAAAPVVTQLEQFMQKLKTSGSGSNATFHWTELEEFQSKLYRAMALDPAPYVLVSVSQVPKNLFAAELTQELFNLWFEVKKSTHPKDFKAIFEFEQYSNTVETILNFRRGKHYPAARAIAKRGTLENAYSTLINKISQNTDPKSATAGHYLTPTQTQLLSALIKSVKGEEEIQTKTAVQKNIFAEGKKFFWVSLIGLICFALGVASYRFNPNLYQKVLDASEHSKPIHAEAKLDYVGWLRTFEASLHRLKASQIVHEKRIEELVANSEKIHQHALSLHSDARIKNEANLEHRMAALIKEIHQQIDQSQKLQAADRIQIQSMLEHCLILCDAVENESIVIDQAKLNGPENPPPMITQ